VAQEEGSVPCPTIHATRSIRADEPWLHMSHATTGVNARGDPMTVVGVLVPHHEGGLG
jgi:hypothetical protein